MICNGRIRCDSAWLALLHHLSHTLLDGCAQLGCLVELLFSLLLFADGEIAVAKNQAQIGIGGLALDGLLERGDGLFLLSRL